jgi:hypothetical protein
MSRFRPSIPTWTVRGVRGIARLVRWWFPGVLLAYDAGNLSTLQSLRDYWLPALSFSLRRIRGEEEAEEEEDNVDARPKTATPAAPDGALRHRGSARSTELTPSVDFSIAETAKKDAAALLRCPVLYVRCKGDLTRDPSRQESSAPLRGRVMDSSALEGTADAIRLGEFLLSIIQLRGGWEMSA